MVQDNVFEIYCSEALFHCEKVVCKKCHLRESLIFGTLIFMGGSRGGGGGRGSGPPSLEDHKLL